MMLGQVFPHPLPQTLNRVQVGTIAGQLDEGKAQPLNLLSNDVGPTMPGCPIPNDDDLLVEVRVPVGQML